MNELTTDELEAVLPKAALRGLEQPLPKVTTHLSTQEIAYRSFRMDEFETGDWPEFMHGSHEDVIRTGERKRNGLREAALRGMLDRLKTKKKRIPRSYYINIFEIALFAKLGMSIADIADLVGQRIMKDNERKKTARRSRHDC